jgi:hypothetical protein
MNAQVKVDVEGAAAGARGREVFAAREFVRSGMVIAGKVIEYPAKRTRMPVHLGWELHAGMDVPAMLLNHGYAPNHGMREHQWCSYDFVAVQDIVAGEELVSDDAKTEHALAALLSCFCGCAACQGEIRPWSDRSEAWREQNAIWVAGHLRVAPALTTSATEVAG